MKAIFKKITFDKDVETRFGTRYRFKVKYDDKTGTFLSSKMEQDMFVEGEENEFVETENDYMGIIYYNLAPIKKHGSSNFSRKMKAEQSKYSGFAMSYSKDLVVAGKIDHKVIFEEAKKMMDWMVEQDKNLEHGK